MQDDIAPFNTPKNDTNLFPWKLLWTPLILGLLVFIFNLQWMRLYSLQNAPAGDSLVYMTEACNDFWTFHSHGFSTVVAKYIHGGHQTSPLLWWLGGLAFLLLGLDPAVAFVVTGLGYLVWIAGVAQLAWRLAPDKRLSVAAGMAAALLPSAASQGLRNFMLDFIVAAPFIWATVFLLASDLFSRRREALFYGLCCGVTVLFRTTAAPYFASHVAILAILCLNQRRKPHLLNFAAALAIGSATAGWFLVTNFSRIISYYSYWMQEAKLTQNDPSFIGGLRFYIGQLPHFHFSPRLFAVFVLLILTGVVVGIAKSFFSQKASKRHLPEFLPLLILVLLVGVPTVLLSCYPSRAATVDYPFVAGYLLLPLMVWALVLQRSRAFWFPAGIFLLGLALVQSKYLFTSPTADGRIVDYRERESIKNILIDADARRLARVKLGNTCIHQHNSLSYKYWILFSYFPRWQGLVDLASIGRTNSAEKLAKMNGDSDYVVTLDKYQADWHPNNKAAPLANQILRKSYGMVPLPETMQLPDGTQLIILTKAVSAGLAPPQPDGFSTKFPSPSQVANAALSTSV